MASKVPTQKSYLGTLITSLFIQGCTVLQGILLARMLGPVGRGEFATIILWPSIFAGIGILGVNMAIARFSGQGKPTAGLVKTAIGAALATGLLTLLICTLMLPFLIPADKHRLLPAAYLFLLFIPINHMGMNLQGVDHGAGNFFWLNATRAMIYPIFFFGLILSWYFATEKIFWVAVSLLVANGSCVIVRLVAKWRDFQSSDEGVGIRTLLGESMPFVVASVISILFMQTDKALLVWLLSAEEIGWYVAALAAAGSVNILNSALGLVQFSASAQSETGRGFPQLARILRRGGLLSVFAGVVLGLLLPWLVPLVYGKEFWPAIPVAIILLPGLILSGLGDVVNQALRGQGQPIVGVLSKVVGMVVMGAIGIVLAGSFGGAGVALGYVSGEIVAFIGMLLVTVRYYQDSAWCELLPRRDDVEYLWRRVTDRKGTV